MDEEAFVFGAFRLLPAQRMLLEDGKPAHLGSRALDVLIALVQSAGEILHKDQLRDLGAGGWQTVRYIVVPIIAPSLVGVALFGFTLSYDEIARTSQSVGALNTLPLELEAMQTNATTPVIYALGAMTTGLSLFVIGACLLALMAVRRSRDRYGSDAGKAV